MQHPKLLLHTACTLWFEGQLPCACPWMQVPVDQPLSFMSFMHAYPALAEELAGLSGRAMQRQRLIGSDE